MAYLGRKEARSVVRGNTFAEEIRAMSGTQSQRLQKASRLRIDTRGGAALPPETTVYELLRQGAARHPERTLLVDRQTRLSYGAVLDLADKVAAGLYAFGIRAGDVVSVQLPNWWHFPVLQYAAARLGAVVNPLPPIYRHRELRFMLGLVQPRIVVVSAQFRGFDHVGMIKDLVPGFAVSPEIFSVGETEHDGVRPFEALIDDSHPAPPEIVVDPRALSEIAFTSGTTGEPKGAMHTHATNFYPLVGLLDRQALGQDDVVLMPSTFGHQTGFVYGGQLPLLVGGGLVLMDRWDGESALDLIEKERVTWMMGATPFLQDLCEAAAARGRGAASSLRMFLCSGAAVPRSLLADAHDKLDCAVVSGWGMTELGLVTLSNADDPSERIVGSDGSAIGQSSVCVLNADGTPAAVNEEGDLVATGPSVFAGYFQRPQMTAEALSSGGWFWTGDRARMDADGYIRITGRSKDIIVRGGENIPVVEVEELLQRHPAIDRVAVVGVPDPRLEERACAVAILRRGASFTFQEMLAYLEGHNLARQYFPEFLEIVDEFPMTPSGKVQKFRLRELMTERTGRGASL